MAGVKADINLSIDAVLTGASDLGNPQQRVQVAQAVQFLPGTDAVNKADLLFADTRTLAASTSENLDLAGVLASAFGATIAAAEVLAIYVKAAAGNTNTVNFGPAASNGFVGPFNAAADRLKVLPGEWALLVSQKGWAVTAGTGDLLTVLNGGAGTSVTYDIVILARTVAA